MTNATPAFTVRATYQSDRVQATETTENFPPGCPERGPDIRGGFLLLMKIPLVQFVLETFEFSTCAGGIRYKIRPRNHFCLNASWAFWNQQNAGRPASKCMSDENGIPYYFIEIAHPLPWEALFLWQERVEYILKNGKDHPRGEQFGGFFRDGGEK